MRSKVEGDDMKLELPADFGEVPGVRYHILAVDILQRRFVVPTNQLLIAAHAVGGHRAFGGAIAEVVIYKGVLPPAQIKQRFEEGILRFLY